MTLRKQSESNFADAPAVREDFPAWYYESRSTLKGHCQWCGKGLSNKRRTTCESSEEDSFRSDCEWNWRMRNPAYALNITSVRKTVHRNNKFECASCGIRFAYICPSGVLLPQYDGHVDHIIALVNGGTDTFSNFQLLCEEDHKEKTRADMEVARSKK